MLLVGWGIWRIKATISTVFLALLITIVGISHRLETWFTSLWQSVGAEHTQETGNVMELSVSLWLGPLQVAGIFLGLIALLQRITQPGQFPKPRVSPGILAQNGLTLLIVAAAVYFSITAMIAASLTKGIGVHPTNLALALEMEIDSVSNTDHVQRGYFEADLEHIDSIRRAHPEFGDLLYPLHWHVDAEVIDMFGEMLPDMKRRVINQMIASDQANLVDGLKQEDKDTLLAWYQTQRRNAIDYLNKLTEGLLSLTYKLKVPGSVAFADLIMEYERKLPGRFAPGEVPKRSKQGDFLGIFEEYMGWLLEIESYSLVMIIGMAGFGLLGAVSGNFIKEAGRRKEKGGAMIEDLSGVMIKGFTAALVIFLGIQGSLAVLGNGMEPPDSNLLFFMALVGSVFSDRAWDWAKSKFEETLAKDKGEGESTAPDNDLGMDEHNEAPDFSPPYVSPSTEQSQPQEFPLETQPPTEHPAEGLHLRLDPALQKGQSGAESEDDEVRPNFLA
ncbi:MAG TPA: hypothetical protein DCR93_21030 [Cytophagales bacterium]|nr:hypothetical protein [Cytophagales bacterium]